MIRRRTFNLRPKSNVSSWSSFEELYQYLIAHKADLCYINMMYQRCNHTGFL